MKILDNIGRVFMPGTSLSLLLQSKHSKRNCKIIFTKVIKTRTLSPKAGLPNDLSPLFRKQAVENLITQNWQQKKENNHVSSFMATNSHSPYFWHNFFLKV